MTSTLVTPVILRTRAIWCRFMNAEDEAMAKAMAEASYGAYIADFIGDEEITQEEDDRIYEQCLIDARRMLCDPNYERIFTGR